LEDQRNVGENSYNSEMERIIGSNPDVYDDDDDDDDLKKAVDIFVP
jgi:hypothetical protein